MTQKCGTYRYSRAYTHTHTHRYMHTLHQASHNKTKRGPRRKFPSDCLSVCLSVCLLVCLSAYVNVSGWPKFYQGSWIFAVFALTNTTPRNRPRTPGLRRRPESGVGTHKYTHTHTHTHSCCAERVSSIIKPWTWHTDRSVSMW